MSLTKQEAYQLNKTRKNCSRCGRFTKEVPIFTNTIRYCDCTGPEGSKVKSLREHDKEYRNAIKDRDILMSLCGCFE